MKYLFKIILLMMMSTYSCSNAVDNTVRDVLPVRAAEPMEMSLYKSDSIQINLKYDADGYKILANTIDFKETYDLEKLNTTIKLPGLEWINKDYACINIFNSGAQSRYIFVPLKPNLDFIYRDKDIEITDSVFNNIVYIDTITPDDMVIFKVENLVTGKIQTTSIKRSPTNGVYPYYKALLLNSQNLIIKTPDEHKRLNIANNIIAPDSIYLKLKGPLIHNFGTAYSNDTVIPITCEIVNADKDTLYISFNESWQVSEFRQPIILKPLPPGQKGEIKFKQILRQQGVYRTQWPFVVKAKNRQRILKFEVWGEVK